MTDFSGPLGRVRLAHKVVETLGWRWALTRLYLEAENRSGALQRRTPVMQWDSYQLEGEPSFRPVTVHTHAAGEFIADQPVGVESALRLHLERSKAREFDIFGSIHRFESWHSEPLTPASYPPGQHWSHVRELPDADLKLVWEPSRFAWVYDLARLHAIDPDTAAPEVFWSLFEDWCGENQPHAGVNWKCGQESAIRLMGVTFGAMAFGEDSLDDHRRLLLAKFADVTAHRIIAHWRYARSQDNNHIVSEAVGLITAALLFPKLAVAERAQELGERLLREACAKLVFVDGGTSQYSLNYHRVFMENFIWAMWLYRSLDLLVPTELEQALRRTYDFLLTITQRSDGAAGNWGNNDGAHLLPLASTRHLDVRPTLCMAAQLLYDATHDWAGPAEEAAWWLAGRPKRYLPKEPAAEGVQITTFPYAGISIMVNGNHRALIRGGPYQLFRPPQCDFGHVELWVDGEQVLFDPGTYSYKPKPGEPDYSETQWHNMPWPEGEQMMTRLSRFIWADWPSVDVVLDQDRVDIRLATGRHAAHRSVRASSVGWVVFGTSSRTGPDLTDQVGAQVDLWSITRGTARPVSPHQGWAVGKSRYHKAGWTDAI